MKVKMTTGVRSAAKAVRNPLRILFFGMLVFIAGDMFLSRVETRLANSELLLREAKPATDWMRVNSLMVSDAVQYEDPWVTEIDREFLFAGRMTMNWEAAVFNKEGELLCQGKGSSPNYYSGLRSPRPVHLLRWWLEVKRPYGDNCKVWPFPVGETCLYTKWSFTPKGYPKKSVEAPITCWQTLPVTD